MNERDLLNQMVSLQESITYLISKMDNLKTDLEETRKDNEKLRFRLSELESALDR